MGELALIHICYNINKLNQKYKEIHGTCDKDKAQYTQEQWFLNFDQHCAKCLGDSTW